MRKWEAIEAIRNDREAWPALRCEFIGRLEAGEDPETVLREFKERVLDALENLREGM